MHKPISMKYGRQVEEASRNVAASSEYESDKWVGPLITLQSLASRLEDSYSSLKQSKSCINGDPVIKVISESFLFELGSVKKTIEEELAGCNKSTGKFHNLDLYGNAFDNVRACCKAGNSLY
jgi:hypothetical protein